MTQSINPADALLADILGSFAGPKAKPEKKAKDTRTRLQKQVAENAVWQNQPLDHRTFAERQTGYRVWKATARVVVFQRQLCTCGEEHLVNTGEFYELANGQAHATWLRPEGYGIDASEDLPLRAQYLEEVRKIRMCSACVDTLTNGLYIPELDGTGPVQMELGV